MDNSILQVMEEPWVVETSYLNLGRLPLLAFLCRWAPLRRVLSMQCPTE
jgi:hypothetical protein